MALVTVSGPARGLTHRERRLIEDELERELDAADVVVSGAAVGVDACAARWAARAGWAVHLVVPAAPHDADLVLELGAAGHRVTFAAKGKTDADSYMIRNDLLADVGERLVAFPETLTEVLRSGTWATVRRFRHRLKPILICPLDGSLPHRDTASKIRLA